MLERRYPIDGERTDFGVQICQRGLLGFVLGYIVTRR